MSIKRYRWAAIVASLVLAVILSWKSDWLRGAIKKRHAASCNCQKCIDHHFVGEWHWVRSPEQERRAVISLYNRYCLRCHGVDGRGVWDMPDVPNFANSRWQASRSDDQLARLIIEGRGAVMPAFRGTITVEQAWAMARYLRTLVPGTESSRPDLRESNNGESKKEQQGDANSRRRRQPPTPQQM